MSDTHAPDESSLFFDSLLDWLVAGLFVLEGLVAAAAGVAMTQVVDHEFAREVVADMEQPSTFVSEPVLVDVIYNVFFWGGVGIAVVGVGYIVAGVAFRRYRTCARASHEAGQPASRRHAVVLGGSLAVVAESFIPFAQVGGGAVAGYLRAGQDATVAGTLAGVVAGVPIVVLAAFPAFGAALAGAPVVGVLLVVAAVFGLAISAAMGAVGGLVAEIAAT
jgi:hypothetical protein